MNIRDDAGLCLAYQTAWFWSVLRGAGARGSLADAFGTRSLAHVQVFLRLDDDGTMKVSYSLV